MLPRHTSREGGHAEVCVDVFEREGESESVRVSEQTRKTVRKLSTLKEDKEGEATPEPDKVARLERQLLALKGADLELVIE
jgi:hypothetical protein